jgi:hypothetical protein
LATGVLGAAGRAAVLGFGCDAACARAWPDATPASAATEKRAKEIERFIYFTAEGGTYGVVRAT